MSFIHCPHRTHSSFLPLAQLLPVGLLLSPVPPDCGREQNSSESCTPRKETEVEKWKISRSCLDHPGLKGGNLLWWSKTPHSTTGQC